VKRLRNESGAVDAIDAHILGALAENARLSLADLARAVRLSAPSVTERLRRLEEAGIIRGYTIAVDPKALGLPVAALLRVRPMPGQLHVVSKLIQETPEIVECDRVTGEDCFVARAYVESVEALEALIDQIIPYAMTNTSIIQSSPVARRLPAFPVGED
jgi:Lrp/AsnC family leucine-responsive transcriptional regulator